MAVAFDPLVEIRDQIEVIGQRTDLSDGEKRAIIRSLEERLTDLQGHLDRYKHDQAQMAEAVQIAGHLDREAAEARAVFREELIDRKLATPEELTAMGYYSHEELDRLAEEGLLEEALATVGRVGRGLRKWDELLHPRGRGGLWIDTPGGPPAGGQPLKDNLRSKKPPPEPLVDRPRRPKTKAPEKPEVEKPDEFTERKEKLEQRAGKKVERAASRDFSEAEAHFNDAGKVSQRTLSQYVNQAATQPTTADLHSTVDPETGERVWKAERRELHERIINMFMRQRRFNPEGDGGKGAWELCEDCPELQGVENPEVQFSGGGYAAGKSSVLKMIRARGDEPDSGYEGPALTLDPDQIKAELDEYKETLGSDPEANMRVYEEAWAISQEIQARAQEKNLNMVVDGISNTSPDEMIERARSFIDRGYKARAVYTDIPTEEAMTRAAKRAQNAKDASDRRHIPEIIMRSVHRDVSATVPNMVRRLREEGINLEVEVYDNHQGKDEQGNFRPPLRFFHYADGVETVENAELWRAFTNKAHEEIIVGGRTV